ncbi:hypothetical protein Tco_0392667 [Tanacetum coccineum]
MSVRDRPIFQLGISAKSVSEALAKYDPYTEPEDWIPIVQAGIDECIAFLMLYRVLGRRKKSTTRSGHDTRKQLNQLNHQVEWNENENGNRNGNGNGNGNGNPNQNDGGADVHIDDFECSYEADARGLLHYEMKFIRWKQNVEFDSGVDDLTVIRPIISRVGFSQHYDGPQKKWIGNREGIDNNPKINGIHQERSILKKLLEYSFESQGDPPLEKHCKSLFIEFPEVKGWLDEDLDNYHLKELRCSTQCHTQMSMWIISRGVVLLILLMLGISFKFGISGLLHQVITTIADRIRDKDTSQSKQNLQSSSMTFIHKTLIIPSVLDSCFISSTVSEVKRNKSRHRRSKLECKYQDKKTQTSSTALEAPWMSLYYVVYVLVRNIFPSASSQKESPRIKNPLAAYSTCANTLHRTLMIGEIANKNEQAKTELKVFNTKKYREQMLLAMKDEAGSNLGNEENDFMLDTSYGEDLEELTPTVMLMARLQPADDNAENVPSYDAKAVSQVHASSKVYEQVSHGKRKTIIQTTDDDQIYSNIIFDDLFVVNNGGTSEHDSTAHYEYHEI